MKQKRGLFISPRILTLSTFTQDLMDQKENKRQGVSDEKMNAEYNDGKGIKILELVKKITLARDLPDIDRL